MLTTQLTAHRIGSVGPSPLEWLLLSWVHLVCKPSVQRIVHNPSTPPVTDQVGSDQAKLNRMVAGSTHLSLVRWIWLDQVGAVQVGWIKWGRSSWLDQVRTTRSDPSQRNGSDAGGQNALDCVRQARSGQVGWTASDTVTPTGRPPAASNGVKRAQSAQLNRAESS